MKPALQTSATDRVRHHGLWWFAPPALRACVLELRNDSLCFVRPTLNDRPSPRAGRLLLAAPLLPGVRR